MDRFTTTIEAAATYERNRSVESDDRPSLSELADDDFAGDPYERPIVTMDDPWWTGVDLNKPPF